MSNRLTPGVEFRQPLYFVDDDGPVKRTDEAAPGVGAGGGEDGGVIEREVRRMATLSCRSGRGAGGAGDRAASVDFPGGIVAI